MPGIIIEFTIDLMQNLLPVLHQNAFEADDGFQGLLIDVGSLAELGLPYMAV